MDNYLRQLQPTVESWLFKGKIILLFGPRQAGKTTLSKTLLNKQNQTQHYYLCELPEVQELLNTENPTLIKQYLKDARVVVFDEAQSIYNIGKILKLLHDTDPQLQIIATGSCSFDLANKLNEPLTGRAIQCMLYPLSLAELETQTARLSVKANLPNLLIYGTYPGVINQSPQTMTVLLNNLANQYLHKDLLMFENLKNSEKILQLLKLIALQLGNEVSIHELAVQLGISRATVERFLDLLQKMFVIFKLGSFSRNLRKELTKKAKYYFYDLGIRNSILQHFSSLDKRADVGALWENFCVMERVKHLHNQQQQANFYFWRTHDQQEIDYIEERNGFLTGFEFKWKEQTNYKPPKLFLETYPNSTIKLITPANLFSLIEKH